jgi:hypothetical protein
MLKRIVTAARRWCANLDRKRELARLKSELRMLTTRRIYGYAREGWIVRRVAVLKAAQ